MNRKHLWVAAITVAALLFISACSFLGSYRLDGEFEAEGSNREPSKEATCPDGEKCD